MINTIILTDFRNHVLSRIKTGGAQNIIITGPNGSGKTAILEAVSMFGGNGALRGAAMSDVARMGGDASGGFSVNAELADDTSLFVDYHTNDTSRRAKIDGDNAPLSAIAKHLRLCWVTPREDRLFQESASERRAFLDRLCASFDAAHSGRNARLAKLLSERAFALKNGAGDNWLLPIEKQMAQTATAIAATRIQYAREINYELKNENRKVESGNNSLITLSGWFEDRLNAGWPASDVEQEYFEYLTENRQLMGDKMVIDGAHKSDFSMFNITLDKPTHLTSTGQQKMSLLSLVCAHARLVREKTGCGPVILLDEVVAHLDANARRQLFDELTFTGAQVWATGIDLDMFRDVQNSVFIACDNGAVSLI